MTFHLYRLYDADGDIHMAASSTASSNEGIKILNGAATLNLSFIFSTFFKTPIFV